MVLEQLQKCQRMVSLDSTPSMELRAWMPCCRRCIKPNPGGMPGQWDAAMVLEQLRAGGVLEAVRIACAGELHVHCSDCVCPVRSACGADGLKRW